AVEKVLFGENEYEKIRKQKLIIQGLVPASLEKESMMEGYFKNKAFEALVGRIKWDERNEKKKNNENEEEIDEGEKATRSLKKAEERRKRK
ncbi:11063_t:CDS:2, partial [Gigaspora rosea]